jgi:hypothetical protein
VPVPKCKDTAFFVNSQNIDMKKSTILGNRHFACAAQRRRGGAAFDFVNIVVGAAYILY